MVKIPKFLGYLNYQIGPNDESVSWYPNIEYFTFNQARLICDVLSNDTDEVSELDLVPDELFERKYLKVSGCKIDISGLEN